MTFLTTHTFHEASDKKVKTEAGIYWWKKQVCTTASWPTTGRSQKSSEKTRTRMCNAVIVQCVQLRCRPPSPVIALLCAAACWWWGWAQTIRWFSPSSVTVSSILDGQGSKQVATGVIALLKAVTKCPLLGGGHLEYRTNCDSGHWHPGRNVVKTLRLFTSLVESD